jgi:L-rhamnose mutarotase
VEASWKAPAPAAGMEDREAGGNIMTTKIKRYGKVIGVKAEKLEEYKRLHANVWPAVYGMIRECNMRNFSIFLRKLPDGNHYLFMYFEYVGDDYDADMRKMAADATTQQWWKLTDPCQEPLANHAPGEWWSEMELVCHND